MALELAALIEAARELSPGDRFELAHQMLISIDESADEPQSVVDAAWQAELRSRIDELESGRVELVDGRETIRIARERIAARRTTHIA